MDEGGRPDLDAIADAVAQRLAGRFRDPGVQMYTPGLDRMPVIWDPPEQLPDALIPRRRLALAGVELTQSIQHHGAAGESYGPDNSVPLVALKPLIVRAYPYVRPGAAQPDGLTGSYVTGEAVLSIGNHVVYRTGPTRASGARVGAQKDLSRLLWDRELTGALGGPGGLAMELVHLNPSLNFRIPAWYCKKGRYHLSVRVWRVGAGALLPAPGNSAAHSQYIDFLNVRPPRIALVRVNWDNSAGTVVRPSDADMLSTMRMAERMLPFPYFETTILGTELTRTDNFPPAATSGGCNPAWQSLLTTLGVTQIFTALFQLGDIVFGMVPGSVVPAGGGSVNAGCGWKSGVGGCLTGWQDAFAHELGHIFDCDHVAVPGDPNNDPNFPNYGGRRRSIGEVGIDASAGGDPLFNPVSTNDIMSYRRPFWISPYTYQKILDQRDSHQTAPADARRVKSYLVTHLRVHRAGGDDPRVEMVKAYRVEAAGAAPRNRSEVSPLSVDLLDSSQRILATHHCYHQPAYAGGCCCGPRGAVPLEREPFYDLVEAIEWPGDAVASVAVHRGGEPLVTIGVGEPPRVEIRGPERREGSLVVRVRARHPRVKPSVVVLFSGDGGETWQPAALDPEGEEVVLDPERLPGGDRCVLRATATAELRSASADTDPFDLPLCRRRLHLRLPSDECGIDPGPVALGVLVDTRGLGAPGPQEVRWHSSLDGDLGAGLDLIAVLSEGRHEITVSAPDGRGGLLAERGIIIVGGREPDLR